MAPPVLMSGSQAVASGARLDLSPAGVPLVLRVPPGEVLATATIRLAAASDTPAEVTPPHLSSDRNAFPSDRPVRFVEAAFDGEIAISGLTLAGPAGMARVRIFGNNVWSPLTPIDTVALGDEQTFPTVAGQRLVAEFLASSPPPPSPASPPPAVPVPTPLAVTKVTVKTTPQPCGVSVAVGDDPPFFNVPGPLPTAPVSVDGLTRIVARWFLDHPAATDAPLRIGAAGRGTVLIAAFEATSSPAPAPPQPGVEPGSGGPQPPARLPDLPAAPDTRRALLCDDGHTAAQRFGPAPAGQALGALAIWVRPGSTPTAGNIALHPDEHGRPGEPAMADSLGFTLGTAAAREPQWLLVSPAAPVHMTGPWWAVCQVTQGEMLWYRAPAADGAVKPLVSVDGGPWQDAPPDDPAAARSSAVAALQAEPIWVPAAP